MGPSLYKNFDNFAKDNAGSFGSIIGQMFGKNPYSVYSDNLTPIGNNYHQYYDPYINAGRDSLHTMQHEYNELLNHPENKFLEFSKRFRSSPGYRFKVKEAIDSANRAASAGGMLGTPAEQAAVAERVHGLADQDFNSYLGRLFGTYGMGLQGTQHLEEQGYDASNNLSQLLANLQEMKASASALQQKDENNSYGGIGNILSTMLTFI